MTDHANELRRYARKIAHPAGDVPSVMLAAAEEIERLAARLEATESDALEQARLNGMGSEREAALMAKLEAAEKERDALRAKIAEMEKQEPVATVIKEGDSRYWMSERLWTFPNGKYPLYALPGAQGEEEEE